ncbi:Alpha beta hydrolase fold family [Mycena indigotica]|uniref:Alpha beta hydrolase fold family n=1 Tax=Mycena indigotica TaxID=2126181 RepID=A0A8H6SU67_9AGAR|nr:Alpha beta hydrolase fold family [Mycena indigotica]KAF7304000.1 Alpha beta hydrolase fold family [Mycena indigotica]
MNTNSSPKTSMLFLPLLLTSFLVSPAIAQNATDTFDWSSLKPSANLSWVPCNSIFQCARLEVPLDYASPSLGTAAIAVVRLPANVSTSSSAYRGPILFNPGGPGGTGVEALVAFAPRFPALFGSQYDFVSFDPRGVGVSTPPVSLFGSPVERALWDAGSFPTSLNASSDSTALVRSWGLAQVQGEVAAERDKTGILKYVTTDNVARDMLVITQQMGFPKLKYYGLSYGSVLGATFAALFPDKVDRMILDADLSVQASSADAALQTFFTSCAAAGPSTCPFANNKKNTPEQLAARLTALTNAVRKQPVPVATPAGYGLVDYSLLRSAIYDSISSPFDTFPTLAKALADLEKGDGAALFAIEAEPLFQCGNNDPDFSGAGVAIGCGDAAEVHDSLEELGTFYRKAAKVSQFAEFLVGMRRVTCSGWKVYRQDRFKGPLPVVKTSFPILFVSNTADPITSKAGCVNIVADKVLGNSPGPPPHRALKTISKFPGSVLLTQDCPGHTSISATSRCTLGAFAAYMLNGTLPHPGTVCPVDQELFGTE